MSQYARGVQLNGLADFLISITQATAADPDGKLIHRNECVGMASRYRWAPRPNDLGSRVAASA
jgi:hypothetical protein